VAERVKGIPDSDSVWLQVPDGYIRECAILFGILGPPSLQPFDPLVHLNNSEVSSINNNHNNNDDDDVFLRRCYSLEVTKLI
jgi:hypothetical protein